MIEGITKPTGLEALFITDEERQAAAAAYIAGMDALFAKFDPETGGGEILLIDAPFDDEGYGLSVIAERHTKILQVLAPDGQWHYYDMQGTEVWRNDGISVDSLGSPDARTNRAELFDLEEGLARLKRTIAERETFATHEPAGRFVDAEEVQKLFSVLMQGRVSR